MWSNQKLYVLLVGMQNAIAAMEKPYSGSLKKLNRKLLYDTEFHFWVYTKELKAGTWNSFLYTNVHRNIIYSSQKVEAIQMFLVR